MSDESPDSSHHVSGELVDDGPRGPAGLLGRGNSPVDEAIDLLPTVARLTAAAGLRSTVWVVENGARVGARVVRVVVPREVFELAEELGSALRAYAKELLGITEIEKRVNDALPDEQGLGPDDQAASLRARGAALLRQSADVTLEDGAHPAYARILTELAPDEARILRLLTRDGPQPMIDVRAANLIGVGSQLVAPRLNMLATEAGCRYPDRVPAYLNNLERLGLVCFSNDTLDDPGAYQVLEAQPESMDAIKRAGRARTVQRSVRLTDFGKDFCEICLPVDEQVV